MTGRGAVRVLGGVRSHLVTRLPEWIMAGELMAEGAQLVWAGDTFGSGHVYAALRRMVAETSWGWTAMGLAAAWLLALLLNGTFVAFRRISPWVRSIMAAAAAAYWGVWAVAMEIGNPIGVGFINHAGYALLAGAYSIIVAREVGVADVKAEKCRSLTRRKSG